MLIDLLDKLIDRCIQLVERREKQDHDLYSDFVTPTLDIFEKIHKNYLETFIEYKHILESDKFPLNTDHPVFNKITEDSQLSSDMRAKIYALREYAKDPVLGRLIFRMCNYLIGRQSSLAMLEDGTPKALRLNARRSDIFIGLRDICKIESNNNNKLMRAKNLVEKIFDDLQINYQLIMDEHVRIKAKLLGLKTPDKPLSLIDAAFIRSEDQILKRDFNR